MYAHSNKMTAPLAIGAVAILITLAYLGYDKMSQQSRDTRRMADVSHIVKAIELHRTGSDLPVSLSPLVLDGSDALSAALLDSQSIREMPIDPRHPDYSYKYSTNNIGTDFAVHFCLESSTVPGYSMGCTNFITP